MNDSTFPPNATALAILKEVMERQADRRETDPRWTDALIREARSGGTDSVESIQKNAIADGLAIVKYVRLEGGFRFAQMGVFKMAPNHEFMIEPHERNGVLSAGTFELDHIEHDGRFYVVLNPHKSYTLQVGPREEDRVLIEEIFNAS